MTKPHLPSMIHGTAAEGLGLSLSDRLRVAVVIPVRNEEASIARCLSAIYSGTLVPDEVLVVDGGSTDKTREIVAEWEATRPGLRLLDNPARKIPHALNIGWRATQCDIVVRIDGHAVVNSEYVERARDHLASGEWSGVGGRKVPVSSTATGRAVAAAMSSPLGVGNSRYHYATAQEEAEHVPFGAYRLASIAALDGWDEQLPVNQDFEFDHRLRAAGERILFDPAMESMWACSGNFRDLAHQYFRYGRGKVDVALKHPGSVRLRHLGPVFSALLLTGLFLGSVVPIEKARRLARLGLALYLAATLGAGSLGPGAELDGAARARVPAVVVTMHNAWGLGAVVGLIRRLVGMPTSNDPFRARRLSLAGEASDARG